MAIREELAPVNNKKILNRHFARADCLAPGIEAWNLTEKLGRCTLRFYDTTPISPSGRYAAVTRLPSDKRLPVPGEPAEIILIDLLTGKIDSVARTHCWDVQLGAQVQWGNSDQELFYNDLKPGEWRPFGVRLDPIAGRQFKMGGSVYMVSPDGVWAASPCLLRTARTQDGYGAVVPDEYIPRNSGASKEDGLYLTNTRTGDSHLHVSLSEIVKETNLGRVSPTDELYGFHVKWNPSGTKLMFLVRNRSADGTKQPNVVTMDADGQNIKLALGWSRWAPGGSHPNWIDDSKILMNLRDEEGKMRFYTFGFDGSDLTRVHDSVLGSGHPTVTPDGRGILTDAKPRQAVSGPNAKTVPIRLIENDSARETILLRVGAKPTVKKVSVLRVDPHPAWSPDGKSITINGNSGGTRNVFLVHLESMGGKSKKFGAIPKMIRKIVPI